jgi:hypothetical protein
LLRGLVAQGATILLTTQQLEEADQLADATTIINHGAVVTEGTPEQLKAGLGYETIEVAVADPARLPQAARVLEPLAEASPETSELAARISFGAPRGARALAAAVRLLDGAGIAIEDSTARRPSLDDVLISVLGHAAAGTGPWCYVDCKGYVPPAMRERMIAVLVEELGRAGVNGRIEVPSAGRAELPGTADVPHALARPIDGAVHGPTMT